MRRSLVVASLVLGACHPTTPAAPRQTLSGIGQPIPTTYCQSTQPPTALPPPRAVLARSEAELAAEVACPNGPTLAQRLELDFKSQYVIVVTITTRAGGYARIHRVDDDGATLTVVAEQVSGGCSGTQQPTRQETFTLLVAPKDRKVRVELLPPQPGPTCHPSLS